MVIMEDERTPNNESINQENLQQKIQQINQELQEDSGYQELQMELDNETEKDEQEDGQEGYQDEEQEGDQEEELDKYEQNTNEKDQHRNPFMFSPQETPQVSQHEDEDNESLDFSIKLFVIFRRSKTKYA